MVLKTENVYWVSQPMLEWTSVIGLLVACWLIYEQVSYMAKGKHCPGPTVVVPFIGDAYRMLRNPPKFWADQATMASKVGLSWNVLFGRFIIFVRDAELSHRIFTNANARGFQFVAYPFGNKLFGEGNLISMYGEEHRDLRRRLAPKFTMMALKVYVSSEERIIRKHIAAWIERSKTTGEPLKMRLLLRDLNLETSQETFVGPYMSAKTREQFQRDYHIFNKGTMTLPLDFPGFAYHNALLARDRLISTLSECARQSKLRMARGEEPSCLVDFWMLDTLKDIQEAKATGTPFPEHSTDHKIGQHIFTFLFASQDTSTVSLAWAMVLLEAHPEILAKVCEEQKHFRPDPLAPITPQHVREMEYTNMVLKEVLRYRPPASMLPHIALEDFAITATYTIPKGTMVFPSVLESSVQGFPDAHKFDPERYSPERREDVVYKRNWLIFGAGPHQCLGQRYAMNHLCVFLALVCSLVDWKRVRTPDCDDLAFVPSLSPKDDALVRLSARA